MSAAIETWVTSPAGSEVRTVGLPEGTEPDAVIEVDEARERQTLLGIGGSLTQASAAALAPLSAPRRAEVLAALFGPTGAAYSLCRTHVASCDFSTESYTYAPEPDPSLTNFSIDVDRRNGHLALLKDALRVPGAAFQLIASPWTAPPWMKDNGRFFDPAARRGGRLLPQHYETYARYVARYLEAYAEEGIDVFAITPVNEPHGNHGAWESMEMTADEQRLLVPILGRVLRSRGLQTRILVYDQNRKSAVDYATAVLGDPEAARFASGTAVHWYDSSYRVFEEELDRLHAAFPDRWIVETEGCIDSVYRTGEDRSPNAPRPWWRDDAWYWRPDARDWGWDWEPDPEIDHPPYVPAFRYARDLVGGLAHWIAGWIDWNVALDAGGGPNHAQNYCLAPILVDAERDDVYYTPLYHILRQVSRHTRPGAVVLQTEQHGPRGLWTVALRDPSGARVVHLFNETNAALNCRLAVRGRTVRVSSPAASLLTVRIE